MPVDVIEQFKRKIKRDDMKYTWFYKRYIPCRKGVKVMTINAMYQQLNRSYAPDAVLLTAIERYLNN